MEVFSAEWAASLADELNGDGEYRRLAEGWRGVLGLAMVDGAAEPRVAILDLEAGACRGASTDPAMQPPDHLIEADAETWRTVLAGDVQPIWGLMSGRLRLTKGNLADLLPYADSAVRIVECARRLGGVFPSEPGAAQR